ncbi:PIR protein, putative [Plasmodium sp. gorilla clade G1]|nr:PIR protein, putative [Plasmodium sp. gorilla clade G1]
MKLHYSNILLFSLPLNILLLSSSQVNVHRKHYSIALHTSKTPKLIKSNRSLCECDIYKPNYDDPEMKNLMENFNKQTQQRFHEYDEHINDKRQKCKEQREKDIKNIILKDKIEKELTEKLSALQTDITIKDIPTCICEKSVEDKMEKTCLKCGGILGTAAPELALLGGVSTHLLTTAATSAATKAGMKTVVAKLKDFGITLGRPDVNLTPIVNKSSYNCGTVLYQSAKNLVSKTCEMEGNVKTSSFCNSIIHYPNISAFNDFAKAGTDAYNTTWTTKMAEIPSFNTAMMSSIIAIVVIVLVMVIIYFILRYRRKKKMMKKLQYIKLLNQ